MSRAAAAALLLAGFLSRPAEACTPVFSFARSVQASGYVATLLEHEAARHWLAAFNAWSGSDRQADSVLLVPFEDGSLWAFLARDGVACEHVEAGAELARALQMAAGTDPAW